MKFHSFRLFAISFLTLVSCFSVCAQTDKNSEVFRYARQIVDTLAAPGMHGRGYMHNGDKIAANYLEAEFKHWGLMAFPGGYRQEFSLSVNTFPELYFMPSVKTKREACEERSAPGIGVLPEASSPSVDGNFEVFQVDSSVISSMKQLEKFKRRKFKHTFLVIDTLGLRNKETRKLLMSLLNNPPQGICGFEVYQRASPPFLQSDGHLTAWDVAQQQGKYPILLTTKSCLTVTSKGKVSVAGGSDEIHIKAEFIPDYRTQNLIAYIPGSQYPDSFIVFSAHYDHLGELNGDTYFPGANDNASGCAMLLNLARYYSQPEHKPKCSIAFMAFGAEEAGLVGSHYYTEHPLFPLKQIKFLVNMDIMGTGDEGITVVNGTVFNEEFKALQALNDKAHYLPEVKIRGKAANSDHYFFSEKGVKAFFIYTRGGIKAYHDIFDRAQTLPLTKFEDVFHLLVDFEVWEGGKLK